MLTHGGSVPAPNRDGYGVATLAMAQGQPASPANFTNAVSWVDYPMSSKESITSSVLRH